MTQQRIIELKHTHLHHAYPGDLSEGKNQNIHTDNLSRYLTRLLCWR